MAQAAETGREKAEMDDAAERLSSSDQIVRDLMQGLYEGRYVPGQRLVEPDLVRRYGVGRGTVREALKRLAAEGLVSVHPFRGARIRQLSRTEARDILAVLELMIGLAARLAAAGIDRPGCRELFGESVEHLLSFEAERDSFDLVRARNRFYRAMTRIGGNRELDRLLPGIQVHLVRTSARLPSEERFADYRRTAAAILAGDPRAAEDAGRAYVRRIAGALDRLPDHAFAPEDAPR